MKLSRRELVKMLGLGGAAMAAKALHADEFVASSDALPPGCVGDPDNPRYGKFLYDIPHTITDGPSAFLKDGKIVQPAREVPVFSTADVVVVGGGPAGFAAAVAAARTGAKVALVERYGSLGGLFTNGMVLIIVGTGVMVDGKFQLMTRGIMEEFMNRCEHFGPKVITPKPSAEKAWQPTIDPEAAKVLMDAMIAEAKVDLFFHAWGVDVIQEGNRACGVVFESKQGRQGILAKVVIDATGDGDMYHAAGADYRQVSHAAGTVFRMGGMDQIDRALAAQQKDAPFALNSNEPNGASLWGNPDLGPKTDALSVRDLTFAEVENRKGLWKYAKKMMTTPGWEKTYLQGVASQLGVRASRLLKAETIISRADAFAHKTYEDAIGMSGDEALFRPAFQIPYRSLLPVGVENVLAAGRCIGCAPDIIDRVRLIPVCMVTGQAAGVAAALAVKHGITPREVDVTELRRTLEAQGARLA